MSEIQTMQSQHCAQVAGLHLAHLNTSFRSGRCALELLTIYYQAICQGVGATGFVAQSDGKVDGYICGVWDPQALRSQMMKRSLPGLIGWTLLLLLQQPVLLADLPKRVGWSRADQGSSSGALTPSLSYELRPIVVSEAKRGAGIAGLLVQELLQDAAARDFDQVHLITESDNIPARKFYERMGFSQAGEIIRDGLVYQLYTISTGASA